MSMRIAPRSLVFFVIVSIFSVMLMAACAGDVGPAGATGPAGTSGPAGTAGPAASRNSQMRLFPFENHNCGKWLGRMQLIQPESVVAVLE